MYSVTTSSSVKVTTVTPVVTGVTVHFSSSQEVTVITVFEISVLVVVASDSVAEDVISVADDDAILVTEGLPDDDEVDKERELDGQFVETTLELLQ